LEDDFLGGDADDVALEGIALERFEFGRGRRRRTEQQGDQGRSQGHELTSRGMVCRKEETNEQSNLNETTGDRQGKYVSDRLDPPGTALRDFVKETDTGSCLPLKAGAPGGAAGD